MRKSRQPEAEALEAAKTPKNLQRGGITPGGFVTDRDGSRWYLKLHMNDNETYGEHLANQVYRRTGNHAPLSVVTRIPDPDHPTETRSAYFSKFVHPQFATMSQYRREARIPETPHMLGTMEEYKRRAGHARVWETIHPASAHKFVQGTATDMLLNTQDHHGGNVGLIPITSPKGVGGRLSWKTHSDSRSSLLPVRIDNGASLGMFEFPDARSYIPDPMAQMSYQRVQGALSPKDRQRLGYEPRSVIESPGVMVPGLQRINQLYQRHGGWRPIVERVTRGAGQDTQGRLTDILEERHAGIVQHVKDLLPMQRHSLVQPRR